MSSDAPAPTDAAATAGPAGPVVAALYRYPVKGLSAERLTEVALTAGEALPFDRAWAIENGAGRFDADNPKPLPKIHFLMLMRNGRLATLETRFEEASRTLTVLRQGKQVARGGLESRLGRQLLEQFFAAYMKGDLRGAPRIVAAAGHTFSDVPAKWLHIINLASLRELERIAGRRLDPLRFRANVLIDGVAPWQELKWADGGGRTLGLGEAARLQATVRCERCEAINVDLATATRDVSLPAILQRTFGHADFGVYAKVLAGGTVREGDAIVVGE
jgi:uncharacterized protein YcbX